MSNNITSYTPATIYNFEISPDSPSVSIHSPLTKSDTQINSIIQFKTFVQEERIKLASYDPSKFKPFEIKLLEKSLENIQSTFDKVFNLNSNLENPDIKETEEEAAREVASDFEVFSLVESTGISKNETLPLTSINPIQVLEGRNNYYIGVLVSEDSTQVIKDIVTTNLDGIDESQLKMMEHPHITLVPPHEAINPLLSQEPLRGIKPFEINFDTLTISQTGYVNLQSSGSQSDYDSVSEFLANLVQAPHTTRAPHTVIGKLSQETVQKIFENPKQYGFELGKDNRLYKRLDNGLKQTIGASDQDYPDDQLLLKQQYKREPTSKEELEAGTSKFKERIIQVKHMQEQFMLSPPEDRKFEVHHLERALSKEIPLTFSVRENGEENWKEFCDAVNEVFKKHHIGDVTVQMLGSGVHGFSRNPNKELKSWSPNSDCDIAIFSKQLSLKCAKEGVAVNTKIVMQGKYTCYKNKVDKTMSPNAKGFHDTDIGKDLSELQKEWSKKIYGTQAKEDEVDFKLNISPTPFKEAISLTT